MNGVFLLGSAKRVLTMSEEADMSDVLNASFCLIRDKEVLEFIRAQSGGKGVEGFTCVYCSQPFAIDNMVIRFHTKGYFVHVQCAACIVAQLADAMVDAMRDPHLYAEKHHLMEGL